MPSPHAGVNRTLHTQQQGSTRRTIHTPWQRLEWRDRTQHVQRCRSERLSRSMSATEAQTQPELHTCARTCKNAVMPGLVPGHAGGAAATLLSSKPSATAQCQCGLWFSTLSALRTHPAQARAVEASEGFWGCHPPLPAATPTRTRRMAASGWTQPQPPAAACAAQTHAQSSQLVPLTEHPLTAQARTPGLPAPQAPLHPAPPTRRTGQLAAAVQAQVGVAEGLTNTHTISSVTSTILSPAPNRTAWHHR